MDRAENKYWGMLKRLQEPRPSPTIDDRPAVFLIGGEGANAVHKTVEFLARAGDLFNRSGQLVRVIKSCEVPASGLRLPGDRDAKTSVVRDDAQPVIVPVTPAYLQVRANELIRFERVDGRTQQTTLIDCPREHAQAVLSLGEWKDIPHLRTVTRAPFLRPDGSVCDTAGYDQASASLLIKSVDMPPVKDRPDHRDAVSALNELRAPYAEMPWADPKHEAAFIALLLTMAARPILDTVPAFVVNATTPGSGKGLLVDTAAIIVHGITPAKRTYPADAAEQRKVLHAVLLAGDAVLAFDNLRAGSAINSEPLCAYVTADAIGDRILGHSDVRRLPNGTTVICTGNNINPAGDFVRRALMIRLDPNCERPEQRRFRIRDLRGHVRRHRAELLHALLTILRGFVVARAPVPDRPLLGSFENWDRLITGSLMWLGMPDPLTTQHDAHTDDPEALNATALFKELDDMFRSSNGIFRVADVRAMLNECRPGGPSKALADAVAAACGGLDGLGYYLRAHNGQVHGGRKLDRPAGPGHAQAKWQVRNLKQSRILIRVKRDG